MRKLLGLALLLVALPACATARSIGASPAAALGDLGQAISGAIAASPQATVTPLTVEAVAPVPVPGVRPDESLLDRRPAAAPVLPGPAAALVETQPAIRVPTSGLETRGVGLHWPIAPDVLLGPALEWRTEGELVVDERLSFGLTLLF